MSNMRIGGLASGMDIDSIVEKLMQAEKAPLNKLQQQKQKYEWQRDAYRDVNKELKAFDTFLFDNLTMKKDFAKKNVTSSNAAVSVTDAGSATGATLNISKVTQLATSMRRVGSVGEGTSKDTTMASLGLASDSQIKMSVMQKDGTFKDVTVDVKATDKISDVASKLSTETGLTAFYDEQSGKFSLTVNATGEGKTFGEVHPNEAGGAYDSNKSTLFVLGGNDVFSKLGFGTAPDLAHEGPPSEVGNKNDLNADGQNAIVTVNGLEIERASNTFDVNGFSITLNDTYDGAKPITLNSTTDTENMVDKIKKFVETYNGLVESLNNKIKETKYRDYAPLTEEQKADMEEDDIKKWEEKAKSGLLRSDSTIRNGLAELRSIMYEKGGSSNPLIDTLQELGITTTSSYSDGGKLVLDEDKLRQKIAEDPDAVANTFSKTIVNGETGEEGIVQKLRKSIDKTIKSIEVKAGKTTSTDNNYTLGKNLLSIEDRIKSWQSRLQTIEERYWKQFTAMEQAINKANQQSSIFMQGQY